MIAYVGVVWWSARGDMEAAIREVLVVTLRPVVGLVLVGIMFRIVRWHYYARQLHWRLPFGHSALAFLASLAFTATPGKAGQAVKFVLLKGRHEIGIPAGIGVLMMERLGDVIAVPILSIASIGLFKGAANYLLFTAMTITVVTLFVGGGFHEPLLYRLAVIARFSALPHRCEDTARQSDEPSTHRPKRCNSL